MRVFNKYVRNLLVWALILVVVLYLVLPLYHQKTPREEIAYSDFLDKARAGLVTQVTVSDDAVSGSSKAAAPSPPTSRAGIPPTWTCCGPRASPSPWSPGRGRPSGPTS